MHRKLKAIGLAGIAAFALSAVLASSASAQFTSNPAHVILSGTQTTTHSFTAGSGFGAISCSTATFSGTAANATEHTQVVQPTYSGCKDSLGRTVDVDNGLTYTFTSGVTEGETLGNVHVSGSMALTVTSGGSVVCTVTITTPQTNGGITYKNLGKTNGVEVVTNTTGIKSTVEGGFFNCGTSTTSATAGSYTGKTVMTAKDTTGAAAEIQVGAVFCTELNAAEGDYKTESECLNTENKKTASGKWERSIQ